MTKIKLVEWTKLDNAAKIFPQTVMKETLRYFVLYVS